jgi:DNA anti-recombination protein RmuC
MSERQSAPSVHEFRREDSDPADPAFVANLQQSGNLANENCDRALALAHKLSAQLREAQHRINQLELEADGLVDRLKTAVAKLQFNADARVDRTNERIARLEAETENRVGRLQDELTQAKQGADQAKADIERIKVEADARVAGAEAEADKRLDRMRAEIEDQFSRLEADLAQAKVRADRAEQWLVLIRRQIEDHLMPSFTAMRDWLK